MYQPASYESVGRLNAQQLNTCPSARFSGGSTQQRPMNKWFDGTDPPGSRWIYCKKLYKVADHWIILGIDRTPLWSMSLAGICEYPYETGELFERIASATEGFSFAQ